jgi:cell division protein FtsL
MLKLLICLISAVILAGLVLQLRQQRMEINYQTSQLHGEIHTAQARLWNQQLQIAVSTAPTAIAQTVGSHELEMVPRPPRPAQDSRWIDVRGGP